MTEKIKVFCSGSIKKGTSKSDFLYWSEIEERVLSKFARPYIIQFLSPADPLNNFDDLVAIFGRDMYQIGLSDFVVVDARQRRGLGVGIEMMYARRLGKPLLMVVPKNSHYRKDTLTLRSTKAINYIHPHFVLADVIVNDFEEAGLWIKTWLENKHAMSAKQGNDVIKEAIQRYKNQRTALEVLE